VTEVLMQHGYTIYDGSKPAQSRIPISAAPHNTLALPASS
jgi:hypothetical protein